MMAVRASSNGITKKQIALLHVAKRELSLTDCPSSNDLRLFRLWKMEFTARFSV